MKSAQASITVERACGHLIGVLGSGRALATSELRALSDLVDAIAGHR